MKHTITRKLTINCTLDSSEAIMFGKGGQHALKLKSPDDDECLDFDSYEEVEITFQIERSQQSRFDHVTSQAAKHREQWDETNRQDKEAAFERMKEYAEQAKRPLPEGSFLKGGIVMGPL